MKNLRQIGILFAVFVIFLLVYLGIALNKFPFTKSQLELYPESVIAQAMEMVDNGVTAQDIEIIAQDGNKREKIIVCKHRGNPKSAIALNTLWGQRYQLLLSDLCNVQDKEGKDYYDAAIPVEFLIRDYFHEETYAYHKGTLTLVDTVFSIDGDALGMVLLWLLNSGIIMGVSALKKQKI